MLYKYRSMVTFMDFFCAVFGAVYIEILNTNLTTRLAYCPIGLRLLPNWA